MPPAQASAAENGADDLERIEGVEPWIAELLRACGVREFTVLADLSPSALATALREHAFVELTTERIEREDWLGQARRLGGIADLSPEAGATEPDAPITADAMTEDEGQQAAGFSLFFDAVRDEEGNEVWQTRIYHEESGQEVALPGIEPGPWTSWILSHALPEAGRGESPGDTLPGPSFVHHLMVRIISARLAQGGGVEGRSERFSVEVRLEVSGLPEIEQALGRAALVAVLGRDR